MATTTDTTRTKDEVRKLMDEGKDANQIAEALGKTKATVYVHIRNINAERGIKARGRGRPPKAQGQSQKSSAPQSTTKATPAATKTPAASNGVSPAARFPAIKTAIEAELAHKRQDVTMLEGMLAAMSK